MEDIEIPNEVKKQNDEAIKIESLRKTLVQMSNENYHILINFLKSLPVDQKLLQLGYQQMDFGMLWIKEVLQYSPIINNQSK